MILDFVEQDGCLMGKARADKLARKAHRDECSPELASLLPFVDPTGEQATNHVSQAAA